MKSYRFAVMFCLMVIVCSCKSDQPDDGKFVFKSYLTIEDSSIVSPYKLGVDDQENIYIADGGSHKIIKYNSTGKKEWAFGKKGRGPGEFLFTTSLSVEDTLIYVHDIMLKRVTVISHNGVLVKQFRVNSKLSLPAFFQVVKEKIYVGGAYFTGNKSESKFCLKKFNKTDLEKELYNENAKSERSQKPYIRFFVNQNGNFYAYDCNNRNEFTLNKYADSGDKILTVTRDVKPVKLTQKEKELIEEKRKKSRFSAMAGNRKIADYKRLVKRIFTDEKDFLYVKTPVRDGWALDIFDSDGVFKKQLSIEIEDEAVIKNGYLYQFEEKDSGYCINKYILKY